MQRSTMQFFILSLFVTTIAIPWPANAQALTLRPPPPKDPAPNAGPMPSSGTPPALVLPLGTSLQVEIRRQYSMKAGETIEGTLLHPLYAGDRLVIPQGVTVRGKVVVLVPDRKARIHARLLGDFTPFHRPEVQFDEIELAGEALPIYAEAADDGAPVLQLSAPGATPKKSLVAHEVAMAKALARSQLEWFTAPGFKDRALQMLYRELPYHPERIAAHTAWSFELAAPLDVPSALVSVLQPAPRVPPKGAPEIWSVNASLTAEVTSARACPGDSVDAWVVEPVYDMNQNLVVPQGAMLIGKVTMARAARSFGRNGKLRFSFQQVRFPLGFVKPVEGAVAGATAEKAQNLQMDAEGTITPRNQSSAITPLLLTMLASRALDEDGNLTANTGVASNGFGMVGRIVGLASGNRNLAAGIGFYAAGLSIYENFLRPGHDVVFAKDTRIEIETTALRAPVLQPNGH